MNLLYVALLLSLLVLQKGEPCSAVPEIVFTISSPNGIDCNSTEPRYRDDWKYHIFHEIEKSMDSNQAFLYTFRKNNAMKIFVHTTVCYRHSTNSSSQCSIGSFGLYLWTTSFQRLMETLSQHFEYEDLGLLSILIRAIVDNAGTITLRRPEPILDNNIIKTTEISLNATVLCPLNDGFGLESYMEILQQAWEDFIPWVSSCT